MSATSNRRSTVSILDALETILEALQWTPSGGGGAETAFGRVARYDSDSLVDAFRELLAYEQRLCLVIPLAEQFSSENRGALMIVRRTLPVTLLLSDAIIGNRAAALWGTATNPGAFGLLEVVLPAVTGQLLDNPNGVQVEPTSADVITVNETKRNLPGRAAVALELDCRGGWLEAELGDGPNA